MWRKSRLRALSLDIPRNPEIQETKPSTSEGEVQELELAGWLLTGQSVASHRFGPAHLAESGHERELSHTCLNHADPTQKLVAQLSKQRLQKAPTPKSAGVGVPPRNPKNEGRREQTL